MECGEVPLQRAIHDTRPAPLMTAAPNPIQES